jgi:hypothetical protein
MELDKYKSAWQEHSMDASLLSLPSRVPQSLERLRASTVRDLHRTDEVLRVFVGFIFGLLACGVAFVVAPPGRARAVALMVALALFADGLVAARHLISRSRVPASASMLEFARAERARLEARIRFDRYSRRILFLLAAAALFAAVVYPVTGVPREVATDSLVTMACVTAVLALAWRRAKSRYSEQHRELDGYLRELTG